MIAAPVGLAIGLRNVSTFFEGADAIPVQAMRSPHRSHARFAACRVGIIPAAVSLEIALTVLVDVCPDGFSGRQAERDGARYEERDDHSHDGLSRSP
jgi:hypothetical protein